MESLRVDRKANFDMELLAGWDFGDWPGENLSAGFGLKL